MHRLVYRGSRGIAPGIRHMVFEPAGGDIAFAAGQFMQLCLDHHGESLRRSYSIVSVEGRDTTLDFAVSSVLDGRATSTLFELTPGDSIDALGPFGRLTLLDEPPCRHVLVATGTGVSPFRAMSHRIEERLAAGWPPVHLIVGARRREDLIYHDEFLALAAGHPGFSYTTCLTRERGDAGGHWERAGRVLDELEHVELRDDDAVYVCGNPAMVDDVAALLRRRGLPATRIRAERYIAGV